MRVLATGLLIVGWAAGTAQAQQPQTAPGPNTTRVSAPSATIHARCDESSPVRTMLARGETVTIKAYQENWVRVIVPSSGEEGCMRRSLLERIPAMDQADANRRAAQAAAAPGAAPAASSGPPVERAIISINYVWQSASDTFSETKTFPLYQETARYTSDYDVESNHAFDIGGVVRIWGNLAAGVAVSRFEDERDITIEGTLPHPFIFQQDRAISGTVPGRREELAVHIDAAYMIPIGRKLTVVVFGGPTIFTAKQSVVTELKYSEQYPYDTVTFQAPTVTLEEETKVGFNVGADVGYFFTRTIGVGGIVRFSRASVPFSVGDLDVGGAAVGGGLRVRFP